MLSKQHSYWLFLLLFCVSLCLCINPKSSKSHANNWAVLVCTSRYWFNYRHIANTLSVYHTIKRLGIPDSHIILMLSEDIACNSRNVYPSHVFNSPQHQTNLYEDDIEVDYRGTEVTPESVLRVLTDTHDKLMPRSKRLLSDQRSNVLIYLTGHGGDGFLKFHDSEEVASQDIANAIHQMYILRRYHEIFFIAETCQAASLYQQFIAPNTFAMAASLPGESSYSFTVDSELGVSVIDRFTHYMTDFFEFNKHRSQSLMLSELLNYLSGSRLISTSNHRADLINRTVNKIFLSDFFSASTTIELSRAHVYTLSSLDHLDYSSMNTEHTNEKQTNDDVFGKNFISETELSHSRWLNTKLRYILSFCVIGIVAYTVCNKLDC